MKTWVKYVIKFQGLEIRNGINGIYIQDNRGRPTGECFVQFSSAEDTETAMKKNREKIGHRQVIISWVYLHIFQTLFFYFVSINSLLLV